MLFELCEAVVPGYYLVCYNNWCCCVGKFDAVVPGYYLVCYNNARITHAWHAAVVPGYYLVCYNLYSLNGVQG